MTLNWLEFSPGPAVAGGVLIGLAASLLIMGIGRIAGISGIVAGVLSGSERGWRLAFIAGLLTAPLAWLALAGMPVLRLDASVPIQIVAGLLVGLGTHYANGCTSGHGVCGLSRRSLRSLVATLVFMAAGFITVYLVRHVVV
ncbi:YeeE/YedE family protein [Chitiniphilus purpureus]|uniref:YeeE/YedE family protein n=1 Tax=Chitiniphilus purpureus TaxID=2981137 RepID=A0ABY6DJA2_9NEIS|nr:YeeE/YedE family protein [Chitiniphilus sp. CD1]UXY14434.1 YeeE/YedE family protein [Chitiniphilus sp. CD1]